MGAVFYCIYWTQEPHNTSLHNLCPFLHRETIMLTGRHVFGCCNVSGLLLQQQEETRRSISWTDRVYVRTSHWTGSEECQWVGGEQALCSPSASDCCHGNRYDKRVCAHKRLVNHIVTYLLRGYEANFGSAGDTTEPRLQWGPPCEWRVWPLGGAEAPSHWHRARLGQEWTK